MISADKQRSALWALNASLVVARTMAYEQASHAAIADVLDVAEYLPTLFLNREDHTGHFRDCLLDLGKRHPSFRWAVERFDGTDPFLD